MLQQLNSSQDLKPFKPGTTNPFFEIKFIRLSLWEKSNRDTSLLGGPSCAGRVFQRYFSASSKLAYIDFLSRGWKLNAKTTAKFSELLQQPGLVELGQLVGVQEVIGGQYYDRRCNLDVIEHAEVGSLNGRLVLAVVWLDVPDRQKVTSIFIDAYGDGQTVHEIHFKAPVALHQSLGPRFSEALRSIQWTEQLCSI